MKERWFHAFRDDPQRAIVDIINGRAGGSHSVRLDIPELLRLWFPPNLADERERLDGALLAWLVEMRENHTSHVKRLGFSVYSKRVADVLIALQLLDLPRVRREIRDNVDAWLRWLLPLRLAPECDPALECHRLLTHDQPDDRHMSTWLELAADGRSEHLTVGLAGLQRLPNGDGAKRNHALMLQGLLHHTVANFQVAHEALMFFNREFGALRGLHSRGPRHWEHVLEESLLLFQRQERSNLARSLAKELRGRLPEKSD